MDFSYSQEQKEYRKEIINFAKEHLNDENYLEQYDPKMWKETADFGLFGLTIGEEYKGLGENYQTAAYVYESLGYACKNNGFIFVINNHVWVSQNMIYLYGSKELKDKYIYNMVEGKKIGAIAITEANAGSDALSMTTMARKEGDNYILNGSKMFISNGPIADIFLVFAITKESPKKITAFVVEKTFEGVKTGPNIEKMGLHACPTSELILHNVHVPKENILGKVDGGSTILMQALEWERCYEFAPHVGVMQRIMEGCIKHVKTRQQFGKPIGDYQAISHKIADMKIAIEMSKIMLYKIAWLKDMNKTAYTEASIFKTYVSEKYIKTCQDAVQIFGAYGYTKEYELERELRDALACSIYSGTNEMQKNTIYEMVKMMFG
ncbi:acyl-CoA dehydrogenase [bacterium 1XD42-8]|jgi:alkylation response protein AidB-like acyl-CoA dehydrogenase|nr:acyl-CoA dehydrogenase [Lachnospiraceae bacterium]RKJ44070.1 acyl-CoA dehydrogenase [bacterium 1XD42-8]